MCDDQLGSVSQHGGCLPLGAGPFDKALTYDASPLAKPLLGSGVVEFAVPVYSKAAAVMAMISHYAAAADAAGAAGTRSLQYGPVEDLMGSDPPNPLQVCATSCNNSSALRGKGAATNMHGIFAGGESCCRCSPPGKQLLFDDLCV